MSPPAPCSGPLGPAPLSGPARWLGWLSPLDIDLAGVTLSATAIHRDLDRAFSRGPHVAVRLVPPRLEAVPFARSGAVPLPNGLRVAAPPARAGQSPSETP